MLDLEALVDSWIIFLVRNDKGGVIADQTQISFNEFLKFGQEGEEIVASYLMSECGVSILPLYQFDPNSMPTILTKNKKLIAPDLTCFNCGNVFFVEVKRKRKWVRYEGELETGFDYKHLKNYLEVEEETGLKVFVVFNHENERPTGLFYTELLNYDRIWDGKNKYGEKKYKSLCFYNYQKLKQLNQLTYQKKAYASSLSEV